MFKDADKILDFALDAGGSINSLEKLKLKWFITNQINQKGMLWKSYLKTMRRGRINRFSVYGKE